MTVYHFGEALAGLYNTLSKCPTLIPMVERSDLKGPNKTFRDYFPDYINMRDSVAHAAEKTKTPGKFEEHSSDVTKVGNLIEGNFTNLTLTSCFDGNTFINTWEGKTFSYELSERSLAVLHTVKNGIWAAFRNAETKSQELGRLERWKRMNATPSQPPEQQP